MYLYKLRLKRRNKNDSNDVIVTKKNEIVEKNKKPCSL